MALRGRRTGHGDGDFASVGAHDLLELVNDLLGVSQSAILVQDLEKLLCGGLLGVLEHGVHAGLLVGVRQGGVGDELLQLGIGSEELLDLEQVLLKRRQRVLRFAERCRVGGTRVFASDCLFR